MAERFVRAYTVSSGALSGLVGAKSLRGPDVLRASDEELLEELCETLDADQEALAALLDEIFSGELERTHAYEYLRLSELLLATRCRKLDDEIEVVLSYYLPNDSFGRWSPVLAELGLEMLAERFGETTLAFPWPVVSDVSWPGVSGFTPTDLRVLRAELDTAWRERLASLPDALLVEADTNWDPANTRDELEQGLTTLCRWVDLALSRAEGLILWMDGDQ